MKKKPIVIKVRENEINSIFKYVNDKGKTKYLTYPRSMNMTIDDVENDIFD